MALIFAREVGAIDTLTYAQLIGVKTNIADENLGFMNESGVLMQKGRTLDTVYYVLNQSFESTPQVTPKVTPQVTPQVDVQTKLDQLVDFCKVPRSKKEMMDYLDLSDPKSFRKLYIKPLLNMKIRYTIPDKPNSRNQKYVAIEK
jgi:ATP-dependent DNA helicase RecG